MFPEEYRSTLLRLAEDADDDMKTLLGLFHLLKGYTTEETLVKNCTAMTEQDCKDSLKVLRQSGILKIGAYNEYLCLSGYEEFFDEIVGRYSPQPGDLSNYVKKIVEDEDNAALRMTELLLKVGKHSILEITQYNLIKNDITEMFSPAIFHSLEAELIKEHLCVYGKRAEKEFLELYQSEAKIMDVKEQLRAWKADQLAEMHVRETLEKEIAELVAIAREGIRDHRTKMAEQAGMSEKEMEETIGYFSGFTMDDASLFVTGYMIVNRDRLYVAITDNLSRYDVREWKDFPVLFITDKLPKWLWKIGSTFKDAYPKLSDRRIAIVVPNKVAYANFKQKLLYELVNRLGVTEISEFSALSYRGTTAPSSSRLKTKFDRGEFAY